MLRAQKRGDIKRQFNDAGEERIRGGRTYYPSEKNDRREDKNFPDENGASNDAIILMLAGR